MTKNPNILVDQSQFLNDLEGNVRDSYGVLDCCVFQNPKQIDPDLFVFVVIDPRRNKQQVIESIRIDSALWTNKANGFRVIRAVGGLPGELGTKARRDTCAAFILELSGHRGMNP